MEGGEVLLACGGSGPPKVAPPEAAVPGLAIDGGDVPLLLPLLVLLHPTGVAPTAGWTTPPTGSSGCVARSSGEGGNWVWSGLCLG